jgi:RHS repeat-associated protein
MVRVQVPGGAVNVAGGNLVLRRIDLSLDTLLGTQEIGAVYNSANGLWRWSFDMSYDGQLFVDASGAEHGLAGLAEGSPIPGTTWVKVDDSRIKTKGGLLHTFDPTTGRLTRVDWIGHEYPHLSFDVQLVSGVDRVVSVDQCRSYEPCRNLYQVEYDAHGCVERISDRADRVALFDHDESCRPLIARDGLDVAKGWPGFRYAYTGGRLTALTNSEGERIEYRYLDGRLVEAAAVSEEREWRVHFAYGRNVSTQLFFTLVRGQGIGRATYRYDSEGRLHELEDAVGDVTRVAWGGMRPVAITDPAGVRDEWTYEDDDLVQATLATGNVVSLEYAPAERNRLSPSQRPLLRASDSLGTLVEYTFDQWGNVATMTNGAGELTLLDHSPEGTLGIVVTPWGEVTQIMDYGDHGRARIVERGGFISYRYFDEVGNLLEGDVTSGALNPGRPGIGRLGYDEDRNLTSIDLSGGSAEAPFDNVMSTLRIEHRSDGQRTRITRPFGGDAEFEYDSLGQLSERRERVDGEWRATRFERDRAGRVSAIELPNGMRRETRYDVRGRPITLRLERAGTALHTLEQRYMQGRLVSLQDSAHAAEERLSYDAAGRVASIRYPDGEVLETVYDLRSREILRRYRASEVGPEIRTLSFGYDGADRQIQLLDEGELVLEKLFDAGLEVETRYGNGVRRERTYVENASLLATSRTMSAQGAFIEETNMVWSDCGAGASCVSSESLAIHSDDPPFPDSMAVEAYGLGRRPTEFNRENVAGMRLETWGSSFGISDLWQPGGYQAYDALGNRLGLGDGVVLGETFEYNAEHNRLLSSNRQAYHDYEYDEAGFLIRRDTESLVWDAGGRIKSIGTDIELEWDTSGRLIRSRIGGFEFRTRFGGAMRADAQGWPLSLDLGEVEIDLVGGERIYRQYDFRGNVQLVTGDAGQPLLHYAYSGWGPKSVSGSYDDDRSFAGGTKLGDFIVLGARLYDPETGRFISPDPIYQVINSFSYTRGNPVGFWDPDGMAMYRIPREAGPGIAHVGTLLALLGIAVAQAGLMTSNPGLTIGGLSLVAIGSALHIFGTLKAAESPKSSSPPGGSSLPQGSRPEIEMKLRLMPKTSLSLECAPSALTSSHAGEWPLLWMVAVQLGLAVVLMRRRRRT